MNAIFKIIIVISILFSVFTVATNLIPVQISTSSDNAIIYFLGFVNNFAFIFPVDTFFICIKLLANAYLGFVLFHIIKWIVQILVR